MENHYSEKQPMVVQNQQSSEHIINNEHVTPSISFQDTMDDVHLTSTRTNSIFLSTPSNDVSMECQNNYESNHNNSTTTNDQSIRNVQFEDTRRRKSIVIKGNTMQNLLIRTQSSSSGHAFQTYCRETSLHGWKYVSSSTTSKLERFCWLFLVIGSLFAASSLVYRAAYDFINQTVSTNMESMSMPFDNLYFPAITICNMNFMQRSVLEKYGLHNNETIIDVFDRMMNTGSVNNFTQEEIDMFKFINVKTNGTGQTLKMEGAPECNNMFMEYTWKNRGIDFEKGNEAMHYAQTTDASLCCQIFPGMLKSENENPIDVNNESFWMQKNPWQIMFNGYKTGINLGKQGVQVLIDVETYDYFSSHSSGSEGVLVLIQHYRDIPLMRKHSFVLSPGYEVDVGLGITEIATTKNAIRRFRPEQRDCFTHDEVNLISLPPKKGYRMSMKNCLYDKALHATVKECNCKPSFYVLREIYNDIPICMGPQLDCAYEVFDNVESPKRVHSGNATEKCHQPCNDQLYDTRITFARYPNRAMFGRRARGDEVCKLSRKLLRICHGWINTETIGVCSFCYGDELKIRRQVLEREYPSLCEELTSVLGGNATMPIIPEFESCSKMTRAFHSHENGSAAVDTLYEYAKRNLLWLNVYVKDSFAKRIVRDEKVTVTSFVANVGGLLGLCMGFSLVSVVEMLYFVIKEKLVRAFSSIFGKCKLKDRKHSEDRNDANISKTGKTQIITSSL